MSCTPFDVYTDTSCCAAQLWTDTSFVNHFQNFFFQFCILRIFVRSANIAKQSFFGHNSCLVHSTTNTNAKYDWRAWVRASFFNNFKNCIFNAFNAVSRNKHSYARFIFGTETFKLYLDIYFIARNDISVDNSWSVVLSVLTVEQWLTYNGFTKVTFDVTSCNAFIDSFSKVATNEMNVLTYF